VGSFTLDLERFGAKTKEKMRLVVSKVALDLLSRIVARSPVDTGRFRANNQIDINSISGGAILEFEARGDGKITVNRGSEKLGSYKLGDTIFIYNNVEYAIPLEYGHSKQAPTGVYRISVEELIAHFSTVAGGSK